MFPTKFSCYYAIIRRLRVFSFTSRARFAGERNMPLVYLYLCISQTKKLVHLSEKTVLGANRFTEQDIPVSFTMQVLLLKRKPMGMSWETFTPARRLEEIGQQLGFLGFDLTFCISGCRHNTHPFGQRTHPYGASSKTSWSSLLANCMAMLWGEHQRAC